MSTIAEHSTVLEKTRELCAEIAKDSHVRSLLDDVERFLTDDEARLQYQSVHQRGEELHQKQHSGIQLGKAEVKEFEDARAALFENKIARDFMEAQESLTTLQKQISQYIGLTLENGRVPSEEEIEEANSGGGCCGGGGGGGCGCH